MVVGRQSVEVVDGMDGVKFGKNLANEVGRMT
jgi:hypothetical protein